MNIILRRATLSGKIGAISSKSDGHRALICSALAHKPTKIFIKDYGDDIHATISCLKALGANITFDKNYVLVEPIRGVLSPATLSCKESGSTLRFLLPIVAALGMPCTFTGDGRLPERPIMPILKVLKKGGVKTDRNKLPFFMDGRLSGGEYTLPGNISSQYISGLLMGLPLTHEDATITLSTPLESSDYVNMTLATLNVFGIVWHQETDKETGLITYTYKANQSYISPVVYNTEGDFSNMATFLCLGALAGHVDIDGLSYPSLQPDSAIFNILARAGARLSIIDNNLRSEASILSPFQEDVSEHPDLFPILAVLACGAVGTSRFTGCSRLRLKESDRVQTTLALITALGGKITAEGDTVTVEGKGYLLGGTCDASGDHRLVMAATVARAISREDIILRNAEAVNKSYPTFFEDFTSLGGRFDAIDLR